MEESEDESSQESDQQDITQVLKQSDIYDESDEDEHVVKKAFSSARYKMPRGKNALLRAAAEAQEPSRY